MSQTEKLIKVTDSHIQNVFGQYDVFMKKMLIEKMIDM